MYIMKSDKTLDVPRYTKLLQPVFSAIKELGGSARMMKFWIASSWTYKLQMKWQTYRITEISTKLNFLISLLGRELILLVME